MSLILIGDVVHRLLLFHYIIDYNLLLMLKLCYLLKLATISETEIICGLDQELINTNVYG
jgi:hypothetical protein